VPAECVGVKWCISTQPQLLTIFNAKRLSQTLVSSSYRAVISDQLIVEDTSGLQISRVAIQWNGIQQDPNAGNSCVAECRSQ